jgi:hypothetical protein
MRNPKEWPINWPEHEGIEHKRCVEDSRFLKWVERNSTYLIAVIGVVVVTAMTLT